MEKAERINFRNRRTREMGIPKAKPNLQVNTGTGKSLFGLQPSRNEDNNSSAKQLLFHTPFQKTLGKASAALFSPSTWEDGDFYASVGFLDQSILETQKNRHGVSPFHTAKESEASPQAHVVDKGRCWACWELDESSRNPLIRVCTGCKDPDLQWIHQNCINKFINTLPDKSSANEHDPGFQCPQTRCARCNEPYRITYTSTHPLRVLWKDRVLRYALALMSVCLALSTVCSVMLLYFDCRHRWYPERYAPVKFPLEFLDRYGVSVSHLAFAILVFCHSVNFGTWYFLLSFCGNSYTKRVHSVVDIPQKSMDGNYGNPLAFHWP